MRRSHDLMKQQQDVEPGLIFPILTCTNQSDVIVKIQEIQ